MSAIASYRRALLEHASNEDILVLLVAEAVRREALAAECLAAGDFGGLVAHVHVARAVFLELRSAFDPAAAPHVARSLLDTYGWCIHHLTAVVRTRDPVLLAEVQRVTAIVEETWRKAVEIAKYGSYEEPA